METRKETHNKYMSDYYKNNEEYRANKILYSKEYYLKNKETILAKNKLNIKSKVKKQKIKETKRLYRLKHKEEIARKKKEYYQSDIGKENQRLSKQRQRARKSGVSIKDEDVSIVLKKANDLCYWCNCKLNGKYHIDHYIPLSKGGEHSISNLVISCPTCNLTKGSIDPHEFALTKGKLF